MTETNTESAPDAGVMLLQDGEMLAFLMGTGPLEGHHFGERHGTRKGAYWWRTVIRERQRADPLYTQALAAGYVSVADWVAVLKQEQRETVVSLLKLNDENAAKDAEIARLREALDRIAWPLVSTNAPDEPLPGRQSRMIARAALGDPQ